MTREEIVLTILNIIRERTPVDTGNLKASTVQKRIDKDTWKIYVNAGDDPYAKYERGQAPYVPFVNEPWISSYWHGKQNPNEAYWNNSIEYAIQYIAKVTGGILK